MPEDYSDGRFRGIKEAFVRGAVAAIALAIAWFSVDAWYWKLAVFLGLIFGVGTIYPVVHRAIAERRNVNAPAKFLSAKCDQINDIAQNMQRWWARITG
jgi:hypothetical protein